MQIYDISPPISEHLAVFPGDQGYERKLVMDMKKGDHLGLSYIKTTVHIGAHADAPNHYLLGGGGIESRNLRLYLGPCQVVDVRSGQGRVTVKEISHIDNWTPRVLFFTDSFSNPQEWRDDFRSLSPELIHWLADRGVRLVGIDTPSVDPAQSQALESHQALAEKDIAVLEGLVLVEPGEGYYGLSALPLSLENADASPVRAILIDQGILPETL